MSQLVVADSELSPGLVALIAQMNTGGSIHAHLSSSNITPSRTTVLGDFTEATFPGYAPFAMTSAWNAPVVAGHVATASYSLPITWTCAGGAGAESIYCVYFTDDGGTLLWFSARMDGVPFVMVNFGDQITETPTLSLESKYP